MQKRKEFRLLCLFEKLTCELPKMCFANCRCVWMCILFGIGWARIRTDIPEFILKLGIFLRGVREWGRNIAVAGTVHGFSISLCFECVKRCSPMIDRGAHRWNGVRVGYGHWNWRLRCLL